MPIPSMDVFEGEDVRELVNSLEKQRKELMFILENLDTSNVNGFNAKVINAGVINGKHLHIDSTVSFEAGYDPEGLRSEMMTQFSVTDGLIAGKVSIEKFNELGATVISNASVVTQTAIQIRAEVSAFNTALDGKINATNSSITQTASSIRSEVATSVSSLDGKITSANSSITQLAGQISSKVESTDYNGARLVSMINQTSASVTIDAKNINLLGITNVANTLYIGENYRDSTVKSIWFRGAGGGVVIQSPSTDNLYFGAIGGITFSANSLSFAGVSSISWGNNKPVAVWG